jgi:hypothetical protein
VKEANLREALVAQVANPNFVEQEKVVAEPGEDRKSVFIERFDDIGMVDPSSGGGQKAGSQANLAGGGKGKGSPSPGKKKDPQKPSLKNIEFGKFIYPDCKMDNPNKPPTMIYLPTAEIMRKMIKACIKVEST